MSAGVVPESSRPGATEEERLARVALNSLGEPGDPRLARLLEVMGAQELCDRLRDDVDLAGIRSDASERLTGLDPRRILDNGRSLGMRFVVPGDPEWPDAFDDLARVEPLHGLAGPPVGVWVRGPRSLAEVTREAVAVVGSRSATTYGTDIAAALGSELGRAGLAARAPTVAVLACGVDRHYPAAHRELLEHIAATGLVLAEAAPGWMPTKVRFLSRNRLIAALTSGTVVVEAAVRSGALNTATWAEKLQRMVMGVPGPVTSAPSAGVHQLLRSGAATLVTCGGHVLEAVSPAGHHLQDELREPPRPQDALDLTGRRVLDAVPLVHPASVSSIARIGGVSVATARTTLLLLEQRGLVDGADGRYRLRPRAPEVGRVPG
jgi:DNA processing protein